MEELIGVQIHFANLDYIDLPLDYLSHFNIQGIKKEMDITIPGKQDDDTEIRPIVPSINEYAEKVEIVLSKDWAENTKINYNEKDKETLEDAGGVWNGTVANISVYERLVKYNDINLICLISKEHKEHYIWLPFEKDEDGNNNKYQSTQVRASIIEITIEKIKFE